MKLKEKIVSENNHSIHSDMNTNDLNFLYVKTNPTPTVSSAILSGMGINPSCYVSDVNGNPVLDANNLLQENKSCVFESTQKMDVDSQGQTTEISGHIDINMIDFLNGIMQMIPYQAGADADNTLIANTLATNADFQGSVADNKKLKTAVKNRLAADTDFQTSVKDGLAADTTFQAAVKGEKGDNGADADNTLIANTLAADTTFQGSVKDGLAADTTFQAAVKGEKGDNGADGADADNTLIANTLAADTDFQTSVKDGLAADTDFQTAVKGEKGDNGADGARGPTGPRGPQGLKGDTGSIANLNEAVNEELLNILPDSGVVFYGDSVKLGDVSSGTIELDSGLFKLELGDEFVNSIESMSFDGAYTSHFLAI